MYRILLPLLAAGILAGCRSPSVRRITRYERKVQELQEQLEEVKQLGLDPSNVKIPPDLKRDIKNLKVYRPYGAVALAVFPGIVFPGIGSLAAGDKEGYSEHLGGAYSGVAQSAVGLGTAAGAMLAAVFVLGLADACNAEAPDLSPLGDAIAQGLKEGVMGPVNYLGSWGQDIRAAYSANEHLAHRVRLLRRRYRKFIADYVSYCHEYRSHAR